MPEYPGIPVEPYNVVEYRVFLIFLPGPIARGYALHSRKLLVTIPSTVYMATRGGSEPV